MARERNEFDRLIGIASEQFETHSKKIEGLLSLTQERFAKDHTSLSGGLGILMIIASFVLAAWGEDIIFCISGLFLGVVVLCVALILRNRATEKQIQYTQTLLDLERERAKFAQKQAILSHVWLYGFPEGTPLAQIQLLLGDNPSVDTTETWKTFPKPEQSEDD